MRSKRDMKFTGVLIIVAVLGYMVIIATSTKTKASTKGNIESLNTNTAVDTLESNPAAKIYKKASLLKKERKERMLHGN